ncbi:MAG: hypothetical protein ACI4MQ_05570 [Candidatus Coproplasma sp.]
MYQYYCIKVYLTNGWVGYAAHDRVTQDINEAAFFDTRNEAESYYYKYVKNSAYGGISVDGPKCTTVVVTSDYPL